MLVIDKVIRTFNDFPKSKCKIVLAFDLATLKSGVSIAFGVDNSYKLNKIMLWDVPSKVHAEDRMEVISIEVWRLLREFVNPINWYYDMDVVIESPYIVEDDKRKKQVSYSSALLTGLCYLVKNRIRKLMYEPNNLQISITMQNNLQWKHFCVGNGDAKKSEIAEWFCKENEKLKECWEDCKNQDMVDSYGILKYHIEHTLHGDLEV